MLKSTGSLLNDRGQYFGYVQWVRCLDAGEWLEHSMFCLFVLTICGFIAKKQLVEYR